MKNKYIKELKETKILQEDGYTFNKYISQLQEFQRLIVNAIYQEDIPMNEVQVDEAISELGKLCRKNNIDPDVSATVKGTLKTVHKELAINMSGLIAENCISEKIENTQREKKVSFKNVYLNDGKYDTEIDDIVLTDEGIIIFEVKSAKEDLIIDKYGRLLRDRHICYDKLPITKSMEMKRNLLGKKIDELLASKNQYVPNLYIESYIVFVTPKDKVIEVTDQSGLEEYCFKEDIPRIVSSHLNSGFKYNNYEFETLKNILNEFESDQKIKSNRINSQKIIDLTVDLLEQIYPEIEQKDVEVETGNKKTKFNLAKALYTGISTVVIVDKIFDLITYVSRKHFIENHI